MYTEVMMKCILSFVCLVVVGSILGVDPVPSPVDPASNSSNSAPTNNFSNITSPGPTAKASKPATLPGQTSVASSQSGATGPQGVDSPSKDDLQGIFEFLKSMGIKDPYRYLITSAHVDEDDDEDSESENGYESDEDEGDAEWARHVQERRRQVQADRQKHVHKSMKCHHETGRTWGSESDDDSDLDFKTWKRMRRMIMQRLRKGCAEDGPSNGRSWPGQKWARDSDTDEYGDSNRAQFKKWRKVLRRAILKRMQGDSDGNGGPMIIIAGNTIGDAHDTAEPACLAGPCHATQPATQPATSIIISNTNTVPAQSTASSSSNK